MSDWSEVVNISEKLFILNNDILGWTGEKYHLFNHVILICGPLMTIL